MMMKYTHRERGEGRGQGRVCVKGELVLLVVVALLRHCIVQNESLQV